MNPNTPPQAEVPGRDLTYKMEVLGSAAHQMQNLRPVRKISVYLVGFHPSKDNPSMQMESHHYCHEVNLDFSQCVLYDGNTENANLHGIEYIISERIYEKLSQEERELWHPHNYEIFSGQLRGPGLPGQAERELMQAKVNSYGKTWHTWMTGVHNSEPEALPLGRPHLAWSFNQDGEAQPGMVERRDERVGVSTSEARKGRAGFADMANPQGGVNALKAAFPNAKGRPAGVRDKSEGTDSQPKQPGGGK
jgi:hypothetical protein